MTVIHRGEINLSDYMNALGGRDLPISRRPKELVIKLELPLMKSAADMELDIKGGFLEFKAKDAGYQLRYASSSCLFSSVCYILTKLYEARGTAKVLTLLALRAQKPQY